MADFKLFLPIVLKHEGGFVNDPVDPGGATNMGITLQTFKQWSKIILNIEPTIENLKALTDYQAGAIYKDVYWDKVCGDDIDQDLANIVCDFYINAGNNATKLLQRVMNGIGASVDVDGIIGPGTVKALSLLDSKDVYMKYKAGRIKYYQNLAASQPAMNKFLNGWLNRVNSFPDLA